MDREKGLSLDVGNVGMISLEVEVEGAVNLAYKCSDRWGRRRGKPAMGGGKGGDSWLGAS